MNNAVHFVGVTHPAIKADPAYDYMVRIFGLPDFVHQFWDTRAAAEVVSGDKVIFTQKESKRGAPAVHAFDDSANQ